jgi:hypothetical protein
LLEATIFKNKILFQTLLLVRTSFLLESSNDND